MDYVYTLDNFADTRNILNDIISNVINTQTRIFDLSNDIASFNISYQYWRNTIDAFIESYPDTVKQQILDSKNSVIAIFNKFLSDTYWPRILVIDKKFIDIDKQIQSINDQLLLMDLKLSSPLQYILAMKDRYPDDYKKEIAALYEMLGDTVVNKYKSLPLSSTITGGSLIDTADIVQDFYIT